jgi:hypothetical protein
MANNARLYPYSLEEAQRQNVVEQWLDSRTDNARCRKSIETAIIREFDDGTLKPGCAKSVIDEYGYKRAGWVLASSIQVTGVDGAFSNDCMAWAKRTFLPDVAWEKATQSICVKLKPEIIEAFAKQYRDEIQALDMFDASHCEPNTNEQDFTGKVLVLSPDTLCEECWKPTDQLWYAHDGFGCSPTARGRSVRCTCLSDGEETRWNRHEFLGVLRDECMPDWAQEKLEQLTGQEQTSAHDTGPMSQSM